MNVSIMKEKNLVFPAYLILVCKKFALSLEDYFLLVYFWNEKEVTFDVEIIVQILKLTETEILNSFNNLMSKKLIRLDTKKDANGKIVEFVNLDYLYAVIDEMFMKQKKEEEKIDIYEIFQKELGRTISPMEYEIIKAWNEKGFSEELILGALKEAVYNGVNSLRYIDTILYEWQRKGYKNMSEVNNHRMNRKESATKELFDYNWLDDNE